MLIRDNPGLDSSGLHNLTSIIHHAHDKLAIDSTHDTIESLHTPGAIGTELDYNSNQTSSQNDDKCLCEMCYISYPQSNRRRCHDIGCPAVCYENVLRPCSGQVCRPRNNAPSLIAATLSRDLVRTRIRRERNARVWAVTLLFGPLEWIVTKDLGMDGYLFCCVRARI